MRSFTSLPAACIVSSVTIKKKLAGREEVPSSVLACFCCIMHVTYVMLSAIRCPLVLVGRDKLFRSICVYTYVLCPDLCCLSLFLTWPVTSPTIGFLSARITILAMNQDSNPITKQLLAPIQS